MIQITHSIQMSNFKNFKFWFFQIKHFRGRWLYRYSKWQSRDTNVSRSKGLLIKEGTKTWCKSPPLEPIVSEVLLKNPLLELIELTAKVDPKSSSEEPIDVEVFLDCKSPLEEPIEAFARDLVITGGKIRNIDKVEEMSQENISKNKDLKNYTSKFTNGMCKCTHKKRRNHK